MPVQDRSIDVVELPYWVWVAAVALIVLPIAAYVLLTGDTDMLGGGWAVLVWIVVLVAMHEGVHALVWKLASGLPWAAFSFGVMWKTLSPYCHASRPMSASAYRVGAAAPLFLAGLAPWLAALLTENGPMALGASVMISGAVGDLFVLWTLRDLPADVQVQDHDRRVGCLVFGEIGADGDGSRASRPGRPTG